MSKLRFKKFYDDVYEATVYCLYRQDYELTRKWANRNFIEPMGQEDGNFDDWFDTEGSAGWAYKIKDKKYKGRVFFLWFPEKIRTGVLVHEVFHMVDHIFSHRGVFTYPNENNEHFAYYIDFWARKIVNYCYECDNKNMEKKYKQTKKEYSRQYRKDNPQKVAAYNKATVAERSSRNKARASVISRVGKAAVQGMDIHHKNSNPLSNNSSNLAIAKRHHSNEGAGKGNQNARGKHK